MSRIRVHALITRDTIAGTDFPVAQPIGIDMLRQAITERYRGEGTILVVLTEAARTVVTQGERGQQQVVPVVVNLTEVRHQLIRVAGACNVLDACTGAWPHVVDGLERIVGTTGREVDIVILMGLDAEQDVHVVVLDDIEVILQGVRPGPLRAVRLRQGAGAGIVAHHVRIEGVLQRADVAIGVVDTEIRTEEHALHRSDVDIGIGKDAPFLQAVVLIMIKFAQGVLAVAHTTHRTREGYTVLFVDGQRGSNLQSVLQRSAVDVI